MCIVNYRISSINTAFLISTPVRYYLNTDNIDIRSSNFISSTPSNSIACNFVTLGINKKTKLQIFPPLHGGVLRFVLCILHAVSLPGASKLPQ